MALLQPPLRALLARTFSPEGLPFPEAVGQLKGMGIVRYRVDYVARTFTAYTAMAFPTTHIPQELFSPAVAVVEPFPGEAEEGEHVFGLEWSGEGVKAGIRKAQAGEVTYREFSEAMRMAGVVEYSVFIEGMRCVYLGTKGDAHTEWFPGAGPAVQ
ncbi:hypothetical protein P154DRAFT_528759 [Amniculicola lignicola CBS 123094]|uniref:Uncharacterized protein n=1 Tax=Amniculicola lignicola CBS 123094 TaxID=1392246 RepID=A0A6A5X5M0_9PLEO|nr:hypothetical protein P154DRAFT_528759 [Amniculicola lignicola CBS 123094]